MQVVKQERHAQRVGYILDDMYVMLASFIEVLELARMPAGNTVHTCICLSRSREDNIAVVAGVFGNKKTADIGHAVVDFWTFEKSDVEEEGSREQHGRFHIPATPTPSIQCSCHGCWNGQKMRRSAHSTTRHSVQRISLG